MKHATDADHLAAVATLATREATLAQTMRQGVAWGVGHTLTLMLFGGVVLVIGSAIPPGVEQALETAVGIMLILLGADVLRRYVRERRHLEKLRRASDPEQLLLHGLETTVRGDLATHGRGHQPRWPFRALAVGMMHGLAGSAALIMLSAAQAPTAALGLAYIGVFGLGSIVGMAVLSAVIALPLRRSVRRFDGVHRKASMLVGFFSCALGATMVVHIGYLRALLAA